MKHETFRREVHEPSRGNIVTRALAARTIASLWRCPVNDVIASLYPNDKALAQWIMRATSAPATTFTTGWAAELAQTVVADTVAALGNASSAADVLRQALVLNWNGAGTISAPGFVATATQAGFVKEGDPIPVRQLTATPAQLLPYKLATIAVLTREMVESGNAEALISEALVRACGLALDAVFFGSAAAVANTQPAGIRNGIATLTASNNSDAFAAVAEDIRGLLDAVGAVGGNGPFVLVTGPGRFVTFSSHWLSSKPENLTVVASSAVGNDIIAIAPKAIVAAISADPDVETSTAGTLVMQDTNPAVAGTTGPERGVYQTESLAVKVRWPVSWALRDSRAVAWLTPAWK